MNVEVLKLRKETLSDGRVGQILDKEDFIRLIVNYKLTLTSFLQMGLSRSLWDNTLNYYGWGANDIEGFRLMNPKLNTGNKTHLRGYTGFTTKIPIENIRMGSKASKVKIKALIAYVEGYFPGITEAYSKYHKEPLIAGQYLRDAKREIMELNEAIRAINSRITKWAKKNGLKSLPLINSKLEHHFAKILDELGVKYLPQHKINKYHYDFILPDYGIVIEVDGGAHNKRYDTIKNKLAKEKGLNLVRFDIKDKLQLKQQYENIKSRLRGLTNRL